MSSTSGSNGSSGIGGNVSSRTISAPAPTSGTGGSSGIYGTNGMGGKSFFQKVISKITGK